MFRDDAKGSETAWVRIKADYATDEETYIFVEQRWGTDAWEYTFYDVSREESGGGESDLPGVDNAFDAVFEILEDDIPENGVRFLDPEAHEDMV